MKRQRSAFFSLGAVITALTVARVLELTRAWRNRDVDLTLRRVGATKTSRSASERIVLTARVLGVPARS